MKTQQIIITAVIIVLVGAAAFFGGIQYQKRQIVKNFQAGANGQFRGGGRGAGLGGINATIGEILSVDSNGVTVKLQDGSSKIVLLSSTTMINKATQGTKDDLTVGTRVAAFGTTNSDGSITASNVQINPMMRLGGGQATPSPTQAAGY